MKDVHEQKNSSRFKCGKQQTITTCEQQATGIWELLDIERVMFHIGEMPLITVVAFVYVVYRKRVWLPYAFTSIRNLYRLIDESTK